LSGWPDRLPGGFCRTDRTTPRGCSCPSGHLGHPRTATDTPDKMPGQNVRTQLWVHNRRRWRRLNRGGEDGKGIGPGLLGPSDQYEHPVLEDIAGSKHWDNVVDQGFVVHRPKFFDAETGIRQTEAHLFHCKARFPELGYQSVFGIELGLSQYRFKPRPLIKGG